MYPYVQFVREFIKGHPELIQAPDIPCNGRNFDAAECGEYFGYIKATVSCDNMSIKFFGI